jgi:hypothetical protein
MDKLDFERVVKLGAKDTERGTEIVARVFYRILRRNGFSQKQVISIATSIVNCLTKSLKSYEKKVDKHEEKRKE